jgi:hypothetical protein
MYIYLQLGTRPSQAILPPLLLDFEFLLLSDLPLHPRTDQIPSGTPRRVEGTIPRLPTYSQVPQTLVHLRGLSASRNTATPTAPTDDSVLHKVPTVTYTE